MFKKTQLLLVSLMLLIQFTIQKNILFYYSFAATSHMTYPVLLARELSQTHNVTFVSSSEMKSYVNPTQNMKYIDSNPKIMEAISTQLNNSIFSKFLAAYPHDHEQLSSMVDQIKPDLVIGDEFIICLLDISKEKGLETIITSSSTLGWGGFHEATYLPNVMNPLRLKDLNFFERLKKTYINPIKLILWAGGDFKKLHSLRTSYGYQVSMDITERFMRIPTISNSFIPLAYPTRINPLHFFTGGEIISKSLENGPLISKWLDDKKYHNIDVIFIGFGSMAQVKPETLSKILKGILKVMNTSVVLALRKDNKEFSKFDMKDYPEFKDRILVQEWVNQHGILAHNSVKLFFSHCGYQSVLESLSYGVPIMGIGNDRDQIFNSIRVEELNLGIRINLEDFTQDEVSDKTKKLLQQNELFSKNVKRMNEIRKSYGGIKKGKEVVEYILEFGSSELHPVEENMSSFVTSSMDMKVSLFGFLFLIFFIFYKFISFCCCQKTKVKND
jgi:UDP:flavonoid glycosyltransferase YjiC (YdhE family)